MLKYNSGVITTLLPFLQARRIDSTFTNAAGFKRFVPQRKDGTTVRRLTVSFSPSRSLLSSTEFSILAPKAAPRRVYSYNRHCWSLGQHFACESNGRLYLRKKRYHAYHGFDVLFDRPVILKADKEHKVKSLIKGPKSWYSESGEASVECQGV